MIIHHYTSIDNFVKILKNKTIRFSRLDTVDDGSEADFSCLGIQPSLYNFVSCWTDQNDDSIPMWRMYSGISSDGVRISVDCDSLFNLNNYKDDDGIEYNSFGIVKESDIYTKERFILPFTKESFLKRITYSSNPNYNAIKDILSFRRSKKDNKHTFLFKSIQQYGSEKNDIWSFQKEIRFVLTILPLNISDEYFSKNNKRREIEIMIDNICNRIPCEFAYYDIPINPMVFRTMEITLGPKCTEEQEIIVRSLISTLVVDFAKDIEIKRSKLTGVIKK